MINSLKEGFYKSMRGQSIVIKKKPIKNFDCFKILDSRNGVKEIFKDFQKEVEDAVRKELITLSRSGPEAYGPVHLAYYHQRIEQRSLG